MNNSVSSTMGTLVTSGIMSVGEEGREQKKLLRKS